MKKLLSVSMLLACAVSAYAEVVSTNLATSAAGGNAFLLLSTRASVYSIQVANASASPATLKFYDQNTMAAPYFGTNWVTAANVGRSSYTTNVTTSYVGFNGLTNWYTNSYLWTYYVTNAAATNALPTSTVISVPAGQVMTMDVDVLHTRGIVVHSSTNATVTAYYNTAQ